MNLRSVVAALSILGPLTCVAYGGNINGEATYVSFSVPGALGTYPIGINASMEVTGYYNTSSTQRGFLRDADGAITTFAVDGATSTVPGSINATGDIAGYYIKPMVDYVQGFLRYADGRMVTFDKDQATGQFAFVPIGINDFAEIAGNQFYEIAGNILYEGNALIRSRAGVMTSLVVGPSAGLVATAAALNANGSVVGYFRDTRHNFSAGFLVHPDGYWAEIQPLKSPDPHCSDQIYPATINASGTIAGLFTKNYFSQPDCGLASADGFVLSPEGEMTFFHAPGPIPLFDDHNHEEFLMEPHRISMNQAGEIAGSYTRSLYFYHGFVRNAYGTITSFDPPEGGQTHVTGINDGGAIAGYYSYSYKGGFQSLPVGFIRIPL